MITVSNTKAINLNGFRALEEKSKQSYGTKYQGMTYHSDTNGISSFLDDGESSTNINTFVTDIADPTCTDSGMVITTDFSTLIVNDQHTAVADSVKKKFFKTDIYIDDTSGALEVVTFERKDPASYGEEPTDKTFVCTLKEYSTPANGTSLTLIYDRT